MRGILATCLIFLGTAVGHAEPPETRAQSGKLELSHKSVTEGIVQLDGSWRFRFGEQNGFIEVPGSWTQKGYPTYGVGIYELDITFDTEVDTISLRSNQIATEGRILANGKLIFGPEVFSTDPYTLMVNNPPFFKIPVGGRQLRLTIEVSNQVDQIAGIIRPVYLGDSEKMLHDLNTSKIRLIPAMTVFLLLLCYFLSLATQRIQQRSTFLLAGLCLSTALFYGVQFAFFSNVNGRWTTYIHLFDLGWIGACYFFGTYCYSVYRWPLPGWFRRYFQHYPLLVFVLTLVLPITLRSYILLSMHLHIVISVIIILTFATLNLRKKERGSRLFLAAGLLMVVATANDILFSFGLIQSYYLVGVVFVAYLMMQAFLLADTHRTLLVESAKADFLKEEIILSQQISGITDFECQHPSLRMSSLYQPSDTAGGDWIFVREQNEQLFFFVADVTDHGMSSALLTIVLSSAVIAVLDEHRQLTTEPAEILERCAAAANKAVCRVGPSLQKLSTLSLNCLEMNSGLIHFIQAGHMPTLVSSQQKLNLLHNSHGLLGHSEHLAFQAKSAHLSVDAKVFVYTDGLTENVDMKPRVLAEILHRSESPDAIKAALMPYVLGKNQDDTTFMALQWSTPRNT